MIIKVPFYGCEKAPDNIINELSKIKLNEYGRALRLNVGNVSSKEEIYQKARNIFATNEIPIFMGGGHAVTYHTSKAFVEIHNNPGIIIFDAHPDCNSKLNIDGHQDLLLALVNEKMVKPENIILVGVRKFEAGEMEFLERNKIKYYSMRELFSEGMHELCDSIMSVARCFGALYISIDIDVADPAFAPDVECPEPGGLSSREIIYFIQRLKNLKNIKAADLCEVSDNKNTVLLGAKIISELI